MGKPADSLEATHMLGLLSARTHLVITGFCLLNLDLDRIEIDHVETRVTFRELSPPGYRPLHRLGRSLGQSRGLRHPGARFYSDRPDNGFLHPTSIGLPVAEVLFLLRRQGIITATDDNDA